MDPTTRTWAEINLNAFAHNYTVIKNMLPQSCKLLVPVKADGYGHGAIFIAQKSALLGADYLAVADLKEGVELRQANIKVPILILGRTSPEHTSELLRYHLTQTVCCLEDAEAYSKFAIKKQERLTVHIKIDTGMTRLGLLCNKYCMTQCVSDISLIFALRGLYCEGIFTHFAAADFDQNYTELQFERFQKLSVLLKQFGYTFEIHHCAASAAMLNYPYTHLDMVRPGLALYGHNPFSVRLQCKHFDLQPVMTLKTRIISIRNIPNGTAVSYGCTHILNRDSRIAILGIGYGDGLPRICSNKISVWINGYCAPVIGRICMDLCMVDVTDIPQVQVGDEAEIWGSHIAVENIADVAGTIQYELLCGVSKRVPRVYID